MEQRKGKENERENAFWLLAFGFWLLAFGFWQKKSELSTLAFSELGTSNLKLRT
jgi:hypothetical protein